MHMDPHPQAQWLPPPPDDELIHWDENYSVGNALLDNEHRDIVRVLNALYHHLCCGGAPLDGEGLMERISEALVVHFANEEEVMARHHCPTLENHRRIHRELLAEMVATGMMLRRMPAAEAEAALARLIRRVVLSHILVDDMDCRHYLHE